MSKLYRLAIFIALILFLFFMTLMVLLPSGMAVSIPAFLIAGLVVLALGSALVLLIRSR